jgi:hypothetical protein
MNMSVVANSQFTRRRCLVGPRSAFICATLFRRKRWWRRFLGLDVSVKETSIRIMDDKGVVAARTDISTDPDLIVRFISKHAPKVERVVHESGILAIWLMAPRHLCSASLLQGRAERIMLAPTI